MEPNTLQGASALESRTEMLLATLVERMDRLERAVSQLTTLANQVPAVAGTVGDIVDDGLRRAAAHGIDVDERARVALRLLERLTEPASADRLAQALDLLDQAPAAVAMVSDVVDQLAARLDMDARVRAGAEFVDRATRPETMARLTSMFEVLLEAESGMLHPEAVRTLGTLARAIVAARAGSVQPMTLFGLLGALREPEVQKAMGFLVTLGRGVGRELP